MHEYRHRFSVCAMITLAAAAWAGPAPAALLQPPRGAQTSARSTHSAEPGPARGAMLAVVGLGVATAASTTFQDADETQHVLEKSPFEGVVDVADWYGDGAVLGAATAGIWMVGRWSGNERLSTMGGDLAESLVTSTAMVWTLKLTVDARRPNGARYSFPSGHTAAAFSVAPVIHHHLGLKAGIAAYVVASLTGMARMEDRRHYLSDVLFGAAIGIGTGSQIVRGNGIAALFRHVSVSREGVGVSYQF